MHTMVLGGEGGVRAGQGAAALTPSACRIVERGFYSERDAAHVVKQILEAVSVTFPPGVSPSAAPGTARRDVPVGFRGVAAGAAPSQIPLGRGVRPLAPAIRRRCWQRRLFRSTFRGGMKVEEGGRSARLASQVGWRWGFYGNRRV